MGDTGYLLARTAQGRSDRGRVSSPGVRVPGVAVYDSGAVLCLPLPAAFAFGDETRSDAAEEIDSLAAQGCASSAWVNSAFAFRSEGSAFLQPSSPVLRIHDPRAPPGRNLLYG